MSKSLQKLEARKLRKLGKSVGEIARDVEVSKSSVSLWCSDIELTPEQIADLIKREGDGAARGRQVSARLKKTERKQRMSRFCEIGLRKIGQLTKRELLLVGASLYWAEGNKKQRVAVFANSDPDMIKIFLKWLEVCHGITKDRLSPYVGINQAHKKRIYLVERYWSESTGIPLDNFTNPSYKKVKSAKIYENFENHYGTLFVRVRKSTNLHYEILGHIEGLKLAA